MRIEKALWRRSFLPKWALRRKFLADTSTASGSGDIVDMIEGPTGNNLSSMDEEGFRNQTWEGERLLRVT